MAITWFLVGRIQEYRNQSDESILIAHDTSKEVMLYVSAT